MGQRWVVVPGTIRAIAEVDAGVAERVFGSSDAIVLGDWPGATTGQAWASYAQFADDLETGSIPEDVRVAMYDPENWEQTPLAERLDPQGSIEAFCALARSLGYFVLITPHANLVSVPESIHAPRDRETREEAFLRSGIVEVSAANADAVETQPQKMQRDPPAYRAFVEATARLARDVKPDVQVMSGLSTHPGYPATTEMLRGARASVRDVVDGHYLSLGRNRRHPDVAAAFLAETLRTTDSSRSDPFDRFNASRSDRSPQNGRRAGPGRPYEGEPSAWVRRDPPLTTCAGRRSRTSGAIETLLMEARGDSGLPALVQANHRSPSSHKPSSTLGLGGNVVPFGQVPARGEAAVVSWVGPSGLSPCETRP